MRAATAPACKQMLRLKPLALVLAVSGCSLAPPLPDAKLYVPLAFKEAKSVTDDIPPNWKRAEPSEHVARGAWWKAFGDGQLDALEDEATQNNSQLASALARVRGARAALRGKESERWPTVGLNAGVLRAAPSSVSLNQQAGAAPPPGTAWQAGLVTGYEVDLFRRVDNIVGKSRAEAASVEANYRSLLLVLQADVAQSYFMLRMLDAEIVVLNGTTKLRDENVRLIEKRFDAGDVAEVDVARARTQLAVVNAELTSLKGQRARVEHSLALLLGRAPAALSLSALPLSDEVRVPVIPAGLPSALLERRADVAAAQWRLHASTSRVGAVRAALFPALVLTADGGYESYELSDLFKWSSRTWLTSLVMSLPLLDGGRRRAAVEEAEAALEGAVHDYRQVVLTAFADVESSLSSIQAVQGAARYTEAAVASARRAAELADKRYRAGEDSYLQLIDSQRELLSIQRQAVQLRGNWALATVDLIRALGGGWTMETVHAEASP